jgi:OOP family OmpA-OmpF porin
MRSELLLLVAFSAGCAAQSGATATTPTNCKLVSSWASPVYRCGSGAAPVAETPAPAPEPVVEAAPPPPPPPKVDVQDDKIELKEAVEFDGETAVIVDGSRPVLDEVAAAMKEHPEIAKVQIQAHTEGKSKAAVKLSNERATAIRKYLVEQGVAADRLTTKGVPRATSAHVEIRITKRKK